MNFYSVSSAWKVLLVVMDSFFLSHSPTSEMLSKRWNEITLILTHSLTPYSLPLLTFSPFPSISFDSVCICVLFHPLIIFYFLSPVLVKFKSNTSLYTIYLLFRPSILIVVSDVVVMPVLNSQLPVLWYHSSSSSFLVRWIIGELRFSFNFVQFLKSGILQCWLLVNFAVK